MHLCAYNQTHGKCHAMVNNFGEFCAKHAHMHPDEIAMDLLLVDLIRSAKEKLDAAGADALFRYVLNGDGQVPDEEAMAYRALWYRHQYLTGYRQSRVPGTPLPAEVLMRGEP